MREIEPRLRRAFLGSRGVDGAADAVSEATAYAWEHWHEVRAMENPTGYLYRVGQSRTRTRKVAALPPPEDVGLPDIEDSLRRYADALERAATARVDAPARHLRRLRR